MAVRHLTVSVGGKKREGNIPPPPYANKRSLPMQDPAEEEKYMMAAMTVKAGRGGRCARRGKEVV